jgi:hypothetical protein
MILDKKKNTIIGYTNATKYWQFLISQAPITPKKAISDFRYHCVNVRTKEQFVLG